MEQVFAADCIDYADNIAGADFLADFDRHALEFGIKGEIFPVANQDALIVTGQHHDLRHFAVEDGLCLCTGLYSQRNAIILR